MKERTLYKVTLKEAHQNSFGVVFPQGWVGFTHLASKNYFSIPMGMDEGFSVLRENCTWEIVPWFDFHNSLTPRDT
jgi:hypothetical protein